MVEVSKSQRTYLPAASYDVFLSFYDLMAKLLALIGPGELCSIRHHFGPETMPLISAVELAHLPRYSSSVIRRSRSLDSTQIRRHSHEQEGRQNERESQFALIKDLRMHLRTPGHIRGRVLLIHVPPPRS